MSSSQTAPVSSFAGYTFSCSCGHTHSVSIRHIYTGTGILSRLSCILREFPNQKVFLMGDANTLPLAERDVLSLLKEAGCPAVRHVFEYNGKSGTHPCWTKP